MINNTMTNQSSIERVVMRRVHTIRVLERVLNGFTASGVLLLGALWGIGKQVWVAKVFSNGPQDVLGQAQYLLYAFVHTDLVVQALTLLALGTTVYLARVSAEFFARGLVPATA